MLGLWKHETYSIQFTLAVDNFRVKYTHKVDVDHLIAATRQANIESKETRQETNSLASHLIGITKYNK